MIYSLGNTKGARPEPGVSPHPHTSCPPHLLRSWGSRPPGRGRAGPGRHVCGGARRTAGGALTWLGTTGGSARPRRRAARVVERPDTGGSPGNRGPRPARPALKGTAGYSAAEHQGSALLVREARWQSGAGRTWTRVLPALLIAAWPRSPYLHHITRIQAAF